MKIKNFTFFKESLKGEFDKFTNDNLGNKAKYFIEVLPEDKKSEFMYRVTDGEDVLDLMEEFINKYKLLTDDQFEFRIPIFNKRIKELKSKYNQEFLNKAMEAIEEATHDFDGVIKDIEDEQVDTEDNEFVNSEVIQIFKSAIDYLTKSQELSNWAWERPNWNPNENKIKIAQKIIDHLKSLS